MPKILICASTLIHITNFHLPYLKFFKELGYEVHLATPHNEPVIYADCMHEIPMAKRIVSLKNIKAVIKLRQIIKSQKYDLIMTHAALAGIIGRASVLLAGKRGAKVIHTSHGYFFWNGCGIIRKIVYYTPELLLRGVTDCVMTMNEEDYTWAQKLVKKNGLVVKVPGMGVDATRFTPVSDEEKLSARRGLSISDDAFVIVYAAEFSKRKNHAALVRAMAEVKKSAPNVTLLLCGTGKLEQKIKAEVDRLGLCDTVRFLGWQSRMALIYKACDLAVSTSVSEGLPFNIIEAQLCALAVVASWIRGHSDLIEDGVTGFLYPLGDIAALAETLVKAAKSDDKVKCLGINASLSASRFTLSEAYKVNTKVYMKILDQRG